MPIKGFKTIFIGIYKTKHNSYIAEINGKYIGSFKKEIEAAKAYDTEAIKFKKKILNFP